MNINNRICTQKRHENFQSTHICVGKDCKLYLKWCCVQCITEEVHNHSKKDLNLYQSWQNLLILKKEEVIQFQQKHQNKYFQSRIYFLQKGLLQCKQIFILVEQYSSFIEQEIKRIEKDKISIQNIISDLTEEKFISLDDNRIHAILSLNRNQLKQNTQSLIKPLESINQKIYQLETSIKNYQEEWNQIDIFQDINLIQYSIRQIDQTNSHFNASSISQDEQYIAYGGDDSMLKIYDIKKQNIFKEIKLDSQLYACQYTNDSSLLFVGTYSGYVYGYDVLNCFKQIFKLLIHQDQVSNIRMVSNNQLITCSNDRSIMKTDIKIKQQIFKFTFNTDYLVAIDYNYQDEMIISGSQDRSIKLWDCNSQTVIINKEQSHPKQVRQIQLILNYQNLLSLDFNNNLYKWRIDLINKELIKLNELSDPNRIFNFYQINQDQNLILI